MKITKEWLQEINACPSGLRWFNENYKEIESLDLVDNLIKSKELTKLQWAKWLLSKLFINRKQKLQYAIFAAEQVIDIYENKYPDNKKPREAIDAAKKVLENDTAENRADAAADAAAAAADAAAYAAAYAAAAYAAAAAAAYAAAAAARIKMLTKILNYGTGLLK